jgi:hypothetical protein
VAANLRMFFITSASGFSKWGDMLRSQVSY